MRASKMKCTKQQIDHEVCVLKSNEPQKVYRVVNSLQISLYILCRLYPDSEKITKKNIFNT